MKTSIFVLAAALCFSSAAASAQSFAAVSGRPGTLGQPVARYSTRHLAGGSITYFKAAPTCDAQHEQYAQLRQAFATSKPTLVLYEWPDSGIDSTETATIARLGIGGYSRFLAQQRGVPAQRFADPVAEYNYLQASTDAEQLKLYYLLREVQRFQVRTGATKAGAQLAMRQLIDRSASFLPGTAHVIRTLPELEAAYRKYCPAAGKWWELPAGCFNPSAPASQTSPALAAINQALGAYRTQQLRRLATEQAQAGQRVLVVATPDYLPATAGQAGQIAAK
ncbi:MAG: hypothetical protein ACRYFK_02445 [Janthinobacterium lividum]